MDIDLALHNARESAANILAPGPLMEDDADKAARLEEWAKALAEAFDAIDSWMAKGDHLPDGWRGRRDHR